MKTPKTIDVDATVTPTDAPGVRGKVEPAPEAKPPATKAQLAARNVMFNVVAAVIVTTLARVHRR